MRLFRIRWNNDHSSSTIAHKFRFSISKEIAESVVLKSTVRLSFWGSWMMAFEMVDLWALSNSVLGNSMAVLGIGFNESESAL